MVPEPSLEAHRLNLALCREFVADVAAKARRRFARHPEHALMVAVCVGHSDEQVPPGAPAAARRLVRRCAREWLEEHAQAG